MVEKIKTTVSGWHTSIQLLIVLVVFNYVDFITTKKLVEHHGFVAELNPLLRFLMEQTGSIWAIFWSKFVFFLLLMAMMWQHKQNNDNYPQFLTPVLLGLVIIFGCTIIWNTSQIIQL